jgi:hypothetical protein
MTKGNGKENPNVSSLDEARRRAAERAKAASRAGKPSWTGPNPGPQGPRTARDWLIGGVTIAMAVGFVAWILMKATAAVSGGAA